MRKYTSLHLLKFIAVIIAAIGVCAALTYHQLQQMQKDQQDRQAQLLNLIHKEAPHLEGDIIDILQDKSKASVKDKKLLAYYGMDENQLNWSYQAQYQQIWMSNTAILIIVLIACFILMKQWKHRQDKALIHMDTYLKRILERDYDLELKGNEEGMVSLLQNDIYKVTVMLREHNEVLANDKEKLASNLADISHQLKTPLTSMSMMCDLLSQEELNEDQRQQFLKNIRSQLQRIEWLVSALLKMSKLDTGTIKFQKETISVKELFEKAREPLLLVMDVKNQSFLIDGDDASLQIDINWTREALLNIMKNCVEHTPQSGRLHVHVQDNPMYVQIIIEDNGTGIDEVDLPHIFERFYRGKNSSSDSVGIGLAMAQAIITSQSGTIRVSSTLQKGTKFTIRFFKA